MDDVRRQCSSRGSRWLLLDVNIPCPMIGAEGAVTLYATSQQIQSFNQSRLDAFNAGGATRARVRGFDATTLGNHATLAVVNRELSRDDGPVERRGHRHRSSPDQPVRGPSCRGGTRP